MHLSATDPADWHAMTPIPHGELFTQDTAHKVGAALLQYHVLLAVVAGARAPSPSPGAGR